MANVPHKVLSANMIYGHVQTQPVSTTKRKPEIPVLQLLIQNHTKKKKHSSTPFHTATKRAQRNPLWCIYYFIYLFLLIYIKSADGNNQCNTFRYQE